MNDEKVQVEFTIPQGKQEEFRQWLQRATEADCPILGYRADDAVQRRAALVKFVDAMETVLRKHDHKSTWRTRPLEALKRLMMLEVAEFEVAFDLLEVSEARYECVDIANYCLILWDRMSMLAQDQSVKYQAVEAGK